MSINDIAPVVPTRRATLKTWQRSKRLERVLETRQVPYVGDPADLIASVSDMVGWRPSKLVLSLSQGGQGPAIVIEFGADEDGVETFVWVDLEKDDLPDLAIYMVLRRKGTTSGVLVSDLVEADDDGGEQLAVPRIVAEQYVNLQSSHVFH